MDTIHQQVADLQHKIDYLIGQMALLTGDSHLPQSPARRSLVSRKGVDLPEADRAAASNKEIGLNRFRALQTNQ